MEKGMMYSDLERKGFCRVNEERQIVDYDEKKEARTGALAETTGNNRVLFLTRSAYFQFNGASPIAIYLKKHGINSRILETATSKFMDKTYRRQDVGNEYIIGEVVKEGCNFVGISALSLDISYFVRLLGDLIEKHPEINERTVFVFGGAAVITNPSFFLEVFSFIKNCVVVAAPGEELMRRIATTDGIEDIIADSSRFPYCIIKQGDTVIDNMSAAEPAIMSKRVPLLEVYKQALQKEPVVLDAGDQGLVCPKNREYVREAFNIHLELGCKAACAFCSFSNKRYASINRLRVFRPEDYGRIIAELVESILKIASSRPGGRIRLTGENIFGSKQFLEVFIGSLLDVREGLNGMDFWSTGGPADVVRKIDHELLEKMREVGFHSITLGTETYSPRLLRAMRKPATVELNIAAIRKLNAAGITAITTCLTFYPSADMVSIRHDVAEIMKLYEDETIYIAFHPVLLAIHETRASAEFRDCIEYERICNRGGTINIPKYIRPRDEKIGGLQMRLMEKGFEVISQIEERAPGIVITRTFEALIYLRILCKEIEEQALGDRYGLALADYVNLYPELHRETLSGIVNGCT